MIPWACFTKIFLCEKSILDNKDFQPWRLFDKHILHMRQRIHMLNSRIVKKQGRIQDLKLGVAQDLKVRGGANGLENLKTTGGGGEYCINSFCSIYTYIYIANKI